MKPDPSLRRPPPPGALEAVVRAGRWRRARVVAGVGVLIAVLGVASVVALPRTDSDADTILAPPTSADCPSQRPVGVPAAAVGFDAASGLVPVQVPESVLLCQYDVVRTNPDGSEKTVYGGADPRPLSRAGVITEGLIAVPADLALPTADPARCRAGASFQIFEPTYLALLAYADARVWVTTSDRDPCLTLSNGRYDTDVYAGSLFSTALDAGSWVPGDSRGPCDYGNRAGQEEELLPEGWTGARRCSRESRPGVVPSQALTDGQARRLADLLGGLRSVPSDNTFTCPVVGVKLPYTSEVEAYRIAFTYPSGRSVVFDLSHELACQEVDQGSLSADLTPAQLQEWRDILAG